MNWETILSHCDHTLLSPTADWNAIRRICDEGMRFSTASVCIPPLFVELAKQYVGEHLSVCTVIGFPLGYQTTAAKAYEAADAIRNGADELDTVIPLGWVKEGRDDRIEEEIRALKQICGNRILKVIIETALLTESEKIRMCHTVTAAGADYIKTSTGFAAGGATVNDVQLLRANIGPAIKVKAAGGIRTRKDAEVLLQAGADRLGSSRLVELARQDGYDQLSHVEYSET